MDLDVWKNSFIARCGVHVHKCFQDMTPATKNSIVNVLLYNARHRIYSKRALKSSLFIYSIALCTNITLILFLVLGTVKSILTVEEEHILCAPFMCMYTFITLIV